MNFVQHSRDTQVVEVRPPNEHYVLVPSNCSLILKEIRVDPRESSTSSMTMDEDVATAEHTATLLPPSSGMDVPYEALREMLVYPLKYAHAFAALNIDCPKGRWCISSECVFHMYP